MVGGGGRNRFCACGSTVVAITVWTVASWAPAALGQSDSSSSRGEEAPPRSAGAGAGGEPEPRRAEEPEESSPDSAPLEGRAAGSTRAIEEIVVTAQKREQSLRDVPISMSVLDTELLNEQNVTDLKDVTRLVPNFQMFDDGFFVRPRMRGFGAGIINPAFEQPVGLVIDQVPYGRGEYFQAALFDLERIELLRGPQGTLFGKNTTVGLVNLVSKDPTDEYTGFVDVEIGELERRRVETGIGGPAIQHFLNFRIAAVTDERDGILANTSHQFFPEANERMQGRDRKALRTKLQFPDLLGGNLVLSYERSDIDLTGGGQEFRLAPENLRPFFRQFDPNADFEPGNFVGSIDAPEISERNIDTFVADGSYDLGSWRLDAVAGYSLLDQEIRVDSDFSPMNLTPTTAFQENPQTSFELRVSSPSLAGLFGFERFLDFALGSTEFTAGFFYQRRETDLDFNVDFNDAVAAELILFQELPLTDMIPAGTIGMLDPDNFSRLTTLFEEDATALAGFAQADWHFLPAWTLLGGMRLSYEKKTAEWIQTHSGDGVFLPLVFPETTGRQTRSELQVSPKAGMKYDWSEDLGFFVTWARGFRGGGFGAILVQDDPASREFEPESVDSWELGSKMQLLSGLAMVNVGLYNTELTDFQLTTEQSVGFFDAPVVVNVGEARARGVETDFTWLALDWLTVRGAFAFNDTEFVDFPFGVCEEDRVNTDGDGDDRCDLTGGPLPRAPKWNGSVTTSVRYPLASIPGVRIGTAIPWSALSLMGGVTVEYQDTLFLRETLDPRTRQGSFFRLDGNLGFGNLDQGWELRVTVENLTNEAVANNAEDIALASGAFSQWVDPPRLVFAGFRWAF